VDSQRAIQEKIALLNMRGDNTKAAEIMSEASTQPQPAPCWSLSTPGMDAYEMFAVDSTHSHGLQPKLLCNYTTTAKDRLALILPTLLAL
jgi:hypothetical protein